VALVVFTGGARSGKSQAAEKLARSRTVDGSTVTVVVFARLSDGDDELAERVARHRADRPAGFTTLEADDALTWRESVPAESLLVLDCLGTLVGRAMEAAWDECALTTDFIDAPADALPDRFEPRLAEQVDEAVAWLLARPGDTIVVTNEVGDGVVPAYASGRIFRDVLGRANRTLVGSADAAYAVIAGRLIDLASLPRTASWPED
jgi:adenosyl cobinamide kinase/adenosyl cobinamide phosphate guanylyltransferase